MRKIPTLFKRDPDDLAHVLPAVTPGCEWVLAGEGVATRKYDGTCVMFDGLAWWARREVKPGKAYPPDFRIQDFDSVTGKSVGWEPMRQSAFAKFHREARGGMDWDPGTYELCGPKINGNPEGYEVHTLVPHGMYRLMGPGYPLTFETAHDWVIELREHGIEGIVWHHPDGRMAKLKGRDFAA